MESEEVIAGKHAVLEALRAGRTLHKIWIADQANRNALQAVLQEAKRAGIVVSAVDRRKLDQMSGGAAHQGVVAQVSPFDYMELEDLLQIPEEAGETPFFLLLDEIEDPHNLGSIIRSADGAGVHGIILPKRRSAGVTATVAKTSAGAAEFVPIARVVNLAQTIDRLKERGIWVAGADAGAEQVVYDSDLTGPLAIVIGNEGKGMGRLVREKCDYLVRLPMQGRIQSLNASVAAGLLMFEAVRQRRKGR